MDYSATKPYPSWWRDFLIFGTAIIYPSTAIFKKVGWLPLAAYAIGAAIGLWVLLRWVLPKLGHRLTARNTSGLMLGVFLVLAAAIFVLLPLIQKQQGFSLLGIRFGVGDSDDAFNVTWNALFAGQYPYLPKSSLGNLISPMPGAQLWALPFYLVGCTVAQNVVWLGLFWVWLGRWHRDFRLASVLLLTVFGLSPDATYLLVQGSDYLTNSIYILIPAMGLLRGLQKPEKARWTLLWSAMLGLGLSSRANFLLLVPLLFMAMARWTDYRTACKYMAVCLGVFSLVTLPVYLWDPAHFSPLHTTGKLNVGGRFPHVPALVFLAGCGLSLFFGLTLQKKGAIEQILERAYFVELFAVISGFAMGWIAHGKPSMEYPHFGVLIMLLGLVAVGPRLIQHALPPTSQPMEKSSGGANEVCRG